MITPEDAPDRDRALQALPLRPVLVGVLLAVLGSLVIGSSLGLGSLWLSVKLGSPFGMPFVFEIVGSTGAVAYSFLVLLAARRSLQRVDQSFVGRFAAPAGLRWIPMAVLLGTGCGVIWVMTDCALPPLQLWHVREITEIPWGIALAIGVIVRLLLGPASEEMLFRGVLYPVLEKRSRPWTPAILSAAIFTIAHTSYYWSPADLAMVFGVGLVAAWLYQRYRTIAVPFLFHATVNLIMVLHSLRAGCP